MKIDHIEVINLKFDYPNRAGFQYAAGVCTGRLTSLVLVHTDTGLVGHGSAYTHPTLAEMIIKQQLEPLLVGEDPCEVETLWTRMYGITRWYGRKGVAMTALGGIDTALWDLRAQAAGKPLRELLGGARTTCPAYASGLLWREPSELAEEAAGYVARGFRRVKMRLARSPEYDRAAVTAVRKAIGDKNDVIVDGSMRYSVKVAREIGKFLTEKKVFWFEEPFAPEDLDSFAALHGTVNLPIAAGENEFGVQGFRELIQSGSIDIVQPDVSRCGGVSETEKIAKLAAARKLPVATHTWCDAVAIVANAHVVSAVPNGLTVEIDQTRTPFVDELLVEPLRVTNGELPLSKAPGLGIRLNESVLKRYRVDVSKGVEDGSYSDMAFGRSYFTPAPPYQEE
jgi:D-galactarolactone cycloisomerase